MQHRSIACNLKAISLFINEKCDSSRYVKENSLSLEHPVQNQITQTPIRGVSCGLPEGRRISATGRRDRHDRALANTERLAASVRRATHCVPVREESAVDFTWSPPPLTSPFPSITIMMSVFYAATVPHRTVPRPSITDWLLFKPQSDVINTSLGARVVAPGTMLLAMTLMH